MQPNPTPNDRAPIADLVMQDMRDRKDLGIQQYGTPLQAFNGRDSLQDAYEETLDKSVYLKQALIEKAELMIWLGHLLRGHDHKDAATVIEATEQLRKLYKSMRKDNADS